MYFWNMVKNYKLQKNSANLQEKQWDVILQGTILFCSLFLPPQLPENVNFFNEINKFTEKHNKFTR